MPASGNNTLGKLFERTASRRKDEPFLIFEGTTFTYAQTKKEVDAIAKGLLNCGLKKGDHIALWMSNSPEWVFIQQAVLEIGAVLVVLNTHSVSRELFYMLRQSESVGLIFEENVFGRDFIAMLKELAPDCDDIMTWGFVKELFPLLRVMIGKGEQLPDYVVDFGTLPSRGESVADDSLLSAIGAVKAKDMAMLLYTSGTTGAPKGALLQHESIYMRCKVFSEWFGLTQDDIEFYGQPLYHIGGCISAIENSIYTGGSVCCHKRFDAGKCLVDIEKYRCTMFYCVPTVLAEVLHHPDFDNHDFSSMRVGIVSGAPAAPDLVREAKRRFIPQLLAAFGCTECGSIVTATKLDDSAEIAATRVGTPTPYNDVRIFDLGSGEELATGEEGEICVKSAYNMACYYREHKATHETIDEEGYLHTGDIGYFDESGYLALTGRKNDMIIVGGVNVYPVEVENALDSYEGIAESQVVGIADERLGEVPFAFIIPDGERSSIDVTDLYRYCRKMLSSFKVPRFVKCVDAFPMNGIGKPMKKELRKQALVNDDCLRLF